MSTPPQKPKFQNIKFSPWYKRDWLENQITYWLLSLNIILNVLTQNNVTRQCEVQENVHMPPTPRGVTGDSKGGLKSQNFLWKVETETRISERIGEGVGWVQTKKPSTARIWIFSGVTDGFVIFSTSNSPCDSSRVTISTVVGCF